MSEISLREHLALLRWGPEYLSCGWDFARVGLYQGAACYEPFGFVKRALDKKRLPIRDVLPPRTRVRFLCSLKFDVLPNPGTWFSIRHPFFARRLRLLTSRAENLGQHVSGYQDMPQLRGDVEYFANPPFSEFPFDEVLTIKALDALSVLMVGENGLKWTLPATSFATVKQITVLKP